MGDEDRNVRCKECGAPYGRRRSWQKFCSVDCRNAWHLARLEEREAEEGQRRENRRVVGAMTRALRSLL